MPKVEGWKAYLRPQVTVSALFGPSELDGLTGPGFTTTVSAAAARVGTSASTSALWGVVGVGTPDFGVSTEASYTWKVGSIHLPDVAARLFGGLDWQPAPSTVARSAGSGGESVMPMYTPRDTDWTASTRELSAGLALVSGKAWRNSGRDPAVSRTAPSPRKATQPSDARLEIP
jgi:hypothetical protein